MTDRLPPSHDDVRLMLLHAPVAARGALSALFALDDRLAELVRTTSQPLIGQMRLAWWRDALTALDGRPPPAEPVLAAIADTVLGHGVSGAALAEVTDGWEAVIAGEEEVDLSAYVQRGRALFGAAARVLGAPDVMATVASAGEGWVLGDLTRHVSDPRLAGAAREAALACLASAFATRWPVSVRPLGLLALVGRDELVGVRPLTRAWRAARFRATGWG